MLKDFLILFLSVGITVYLYSVFEKNGLNMIAIINLMWGSWL